MALPISAIEHAVRGIDMIQGSDDLLSCLFGYLILGHAHSDIGRASCRERV